MWTEDMPIMCPRHLVLRHLQQSCMPPSLEEILAEDEDEEVLLRNLKQMSDPKGAEDKAAGDEVPVDLCRSIPSAELENSSELCIYDKAGNIFQLSSILSNEGIEFAEELETEAEEAASSTASAAETAVQDTTAASTATATATSSPSLGGASLWSLLSGCERERRWLLRPPTRIGSLTVSSYFSAPSATTVDPSHPTLAPVCCRMSSCSQLPAPWGQLRRLFTSSPSSVEGMLAVLVVLAFHFLSGTAGSMAAAGLRHLAALFPLADPAIGAVLRWEDDDDVVVGAVAMTALVLTAAALFGWLLYLQRRDPPSLLESTTFTLGQLISWASLCTVCMVGLWVGMVQSDRERRSSSVVEKIKEKTVTEPSPVWVAFLCSVALIATLGYIIQQDSIACHHCGGGGRGRRKVVVVVR